MSTILQHRRKAFSSVPGLLDAFGGASVAYSTRKLRSAYSGPALRVRRASDNTELDIGFSSGALDTAALASFCAATNGFVSKWYDQSGNGIDASQAASGNQPKIVSSGSVITQGTRAAMLFDGSTSKLTFSQVSIGSTWSNFAVCGRTSSAVTMMLFGPASGYNGPLSLNLVGTAGYVESATGFYSQYTISDTGGINLAMICTASLEKLWRNGTQLSPVTSHAGYGGVGLGFATIGNLPSLGYWHNGTMQEMILWLSDKSADVAAIELDQNTHFASH